MDKNDFSQALLTSLLGLLPIIVTELNDWLQKRTKDARKDGAIDFAQRRVAFLSAWLQARQQAATSRNISQIKKTVANELDAIKTGVDEILQAAPEKSAKKPEVFAALVPVWILSRIIGFLEFFFPLIILIYSALPGRVGILNSLSAYYYTDLQSIYVGLLFGIGVCLLLYHGRNQIEKFAGYIGGVSAMAIALIPTSPNAEAPGNAILPLVFLYLFFFTMVFFPYNWSRNLQMSPQLSRRRLRLYIYRFCGNTILICVFLLAIFSAIPAFTRFLETYRPVYWLETLAFMLSGMSWLTRGRIFGFDPDEVTDLPQTRSNAR